MKFSKRKEPKPEYVIWVVDNKGKGTLYNYRSERAQAKALREFDRMFEAGEISSFTTTPKKSRFL